MSDPNLERFRAACCCHDVGDKPTFESLVNFKRRELLTSASEKLDEGAMILAELAKEYAFYASQTEEMFKKEEAARACSDIMNSYKSIRNISEMLKDAREITLLGGNNR